MKKQIIIYARTSTAGQTLGINSQISICTEYATAHNGKIIAVFSEHESGKNDNREELRKAIEACKQHNATLIVAKLDRLSRKVEFLFALKEILERENIQWMCCDNPQVSGNTLLLGILASLAQSERETISQRTKAALAELKRQGKQLGGTRECADGTTNTQKMINAARSSNRQYADDWAQKICPVICAMRKNGMTLQAIANTCNNQNMRTRRGAEFTPKAIARIVKRCDNFK